MGWWESIKSLLFNSVAWFLLWNVLGLFFIILPYSLTQPSNVNINVAEMKKTFPAIGFAIRNADYQACLNNHKDTKTHSIELKKKDACRKEHMEKKDTDAKISLADFYERDFSVFEDEVEVKNQMLFASVWHYYTTLHEYRVKYQGYRRYEQDLCDAKNCLTSAPFHVTVKEDTLKNLQTSYPDATRNDELGIFVETYNDLLYEADLPAFGLEQPSAGTPYDVIYKGSDEKYKVFKVDVGYYELSVSNAAKDAQVTNTSLSKLLISRMNKFHNVTYLSQWEYDVSGLKAGNTVVFATFEGVKKSITFSTVKTYNAPHTCMTCKKIRNPSTPFLPIDFKTNKLHKDGAEYLASPDVCLKASSDSLITGVINTVWHVVLLLLLSWAFSLVKTGTDNISTKASARFTLIALFLNAGLIRLWTYSSVWNCKYVTGVAGINQGFGAALFVWGLVVLVVELYKTFIKKRYSRLPSETPAQTTQVTATIGTTAQGQTPTSQGVSAYMFRV